MCFTHNLQKLNEDKYEAQKPISEQVLKFNNIKKDE